MPTPTESSYHLPMINFNIASLQIASLQADVKTKKIHFPFNKKITVVEDNVIPAFRDCDEFVNQICKKEISHANTGVLSDEFTQPSLSPFHPAQIQKLQESLLEHKQKTIGRYDLGTFIGTKEFVETLEGHLEWLDINPITLKDVFFIGKGTRFLFTLEWIEDCINKFQEANSKKFKEKEIDLILLFTENLKNALKKRIGKWPNDFDFRLYFDKNANRNTLKEVNASLLNYLNSQVEDWSEQKINEALSFLKNEEIKKPENEKRFYIFQWDINTSNIQLLLIKELSLIKQHIEPRSFESNDNPLLHYSTHTTGSQEPGALTIEWLAVLKSPRSCMSADDDLYLSLLDFIHDPTETITPKGWQKNGWPSIINLIGHIHAPSEDEHLYSPANLIKLFAEYGDGVRCISSTVEEKYFVTLPIENQIDHLDQYCQAYIKERYKDNVWGHIAFALNTCLSKSVQKHQLEDAEKIFKKLICEKNDVFTKENDSDLLLKLASLHYNHNLPLKHISALLDVSAFLHCQTQLDFDSSESVQAIYIENGKVPTALVKVPCPDGEERHLQVRSDLTESLKTLINEAPKDAGKLEKILALLLPLKSFKMHHCSPLLRAKKALNINLDELTDLACDFLLRSETYLKHIGVYLVFAVNTMGQKKLPVHSLIENIPGLLFRSDASRRKLLIDEISKLLPESSVLAVLSKHEESNEFVFAAFIEDYIKALSQSHDVVERNVGVALFKSHYTGIAAPYPILEFFLKSKNLSVIELFSKLKLSSRQNTQCLNIILSNLHSLSQAAQIQAINYLSKQLKTLQSYSDWEQSSKNLLQFSRIIDFFMLHNAPKLAHQFLLIGVNKNFLSADYTRKYLDVYIEADSFSKALELLNVLPLNTDFPMEDLHQLLTLVNKISFSNDVKTHLEYQKSLKARTIAILENTGSDSTILANHEKALMWLMPFLLEKSEDCYRLLALSKKQNWISETSLKKIWMDACQNLVEIQEFDKAYKLWHLGHKNKFSDNLSRDLQYISLVKSFTEHYLKSAKLHDRILIMHSTVAKKTPHDEVIVDLQIAWWKKKIEKDPALAFEDLIQEPNLSTHSKKMVGTYLISHLLEKAYFKEFSQLVSRMPSLSISEDHIEKLMNSSLSTKEKKIYLTTLLASTDVQTQKRGQWITSLCENLIKSEEIDEASSLISHPALTSAEGVPLKIQIISHYQNLNKMKEASQKLIELCQEYKAQEYPTIKSAIKSYVEKALKASTNYQKVLECDDILSHLSGQEYVELSCMVCENTRTYIRGVFHYNLLTKALVKIKEDPSLLNANNLSEKIASEVNLTLNHTQKAITIDYTNFKDSCSLTLPLIVKSLLNNENSIINNQVRLERCLSLLETCRIQKIFLAISQNDLLNLIERITTDETKVLQNYKLVEEYLQALTANLNPNEEVIIFNYVRTLQLASPSAAVQLINTSSLHTNESDEWHQLVKSLYNDTTLSESTKAQMFLKLPTLQTLHSEALKLSLKLINNKNFKQAIELIQKFGNDHSSEWFICFESLAKPENFRFRHLLENQTKKVFGDYLKQNSVFPTYWLFAVTMHDEHLKSLFKHEIFLEQIILRFSSMSTEESVCFFKLFPHFETILKDETDPAEKERMIHLSKKIFEEFKVRAPHDLQLHSKTLALETEAFLLSIQLDKKDPLIYSDAVNKTYEFFKDKSIPLSPEDKKNKVNRLYIKLLEKIFYHLPEKLNPFDFAFQSILKELVKRIKTEEVSSESYLNALTCVGNFDRSLQIEFLKSYASQHQPITNIDKITQITKNHLTTFKELFFYLLTFPPLSTEWTLAFKLAIRPEFQMPEITSQLPPAAINIFNKDLNKVDNSPENIRITGSRPLTLEANFEVLRDYESLGLIFSQCLSNLRVKIEEWNLLKSTYIPLITGLVKKRIFLPNDLKAFLNIILKRFEKTEYLELISQTRSLDIFCAVLENIIGSMEIKPETTLFSHRENLVVLGDIILPFLRIFSNEQEAKDILKLYIQTLIKTWNEPLTGLAKKILDECAKNNLLRKNDPLYQELEILSCSYHSKYPEKIDNKEAYLNSSKFLFSLKTERCQMSAKNILSYYLKLRS